MQRKVYRTKLKPEWREAYIAAHRTFSRELLQRYRAAGLRSCVVYALDDDLVLVTEAEDHTRVCSILSQDNLDQEWQEFVRPMKGDGDWQEMRELFVADLSPADLP